MNRKDLAALPGHYEKIRSLDLSADKRAALTVTVISLGIFLPLFVIGLISVPLFRIDKDLPAFLLKMAVTAAGSFLYIVLHELIHGVLMRGFSGVRPRYGFTGLYAYAGSDVFFCRTHYIIIALAPIVTWGIVLQLLCAMVPRDWFWPVYFIQLFNLSGAAGDLYVTVLFSRMPADILIRDSGVSMEVYASSKKEHTQPL